MKNIATKKRLFSFIPGLVLLVLLTSPLTAMATFDDLTLSDADDFTILAAYDDIGDEESMTVLGLDTSTWGTETIQDPQHLTWEVEDNSVVKFDDGGTLYSIITGTDTVDVEVIGVGRSYVYVTYDNGVDDPISVHSYIVVEASSGSSSVSLITVAVYDGEDLVFIEPFITVDLDVLDWLSPNDGMVLQQNPSALHALAAGGNEANSDDDWAEDELSLYYGGSYVYGIEDTYASSTEGWTYAVGRWVGGEIEIYTDPDYAASIFEIESGDVVVWYYDEY